ncbi:hypothetical protein Tco_1559283 [Tanacetum coccineum]
MKLTYTNFSKDPRLPLRLDLVPRRVVHRELPEDLPEEVTLMRRGVTERHERASIIPLKPDLLRAQLILITQDQSSSSLEQTTATSSSSSSSSLVRSSSSRFSYHEEGRLYH